MLELLLSQEKVVSLLYGKTFPVSGRNTAKTVDGDPGRPSTVNFAALSSVIDGSDDLIRDGSESRPLTARILGTPGERDREREKLPQIPSTSLLRPRTEE